MDHTNQNTPQSWDFPPNKPTVPQGPFFPTQGREFLFGLAILITGWLLCNSALYAGFYLGFAIFSAIAILCSVAYLLSRGCGMSVYSGILLALSLVIAASFARSDDSFVKFVMFCFLLISTNLGLCLMAGQNRRSPKGILSLLDVPRTVFSLGLGKLPEAFRGLYWGFRNSGKTSKKGGAVLLGLLIAVPLLAIVIPLLVSADAAFDALLQRLPDWSFGQIIGSIIFGTLLACFLYTRGTSLRHAPKEQPDSKVRKGVNALTINTVLIMISLVYCMYLISQLAYFAGGFSGILPEDYTMAQYARRGFFEMAWLCAINLGIIAFSAGLVRKETRTPLSTRLVCLFIGIVTLFFVVSASAKMFLYINSFGLTRMRVLTEVIMLWLGLSTATVCIWLFVPKLPYMKLVLVLALVMGAVVAWADVDTVVARYNVSAYQSGKLESVDVEYLDSLGNGAIPYIARLTQDPDTTIAQNAKEALSGYHYYSFDDFRDWNYAHHIAQQFIAPKGEATDTIS